MSEDEFTRTVGLWDLLLLSVGGMIGSAVFYFPAFTGLWVGSASVLAWFLAGVGMLCVALCYTELSTAFPEQGGPAVFPAETLGRRPIVKRFFSYLEGICYTLGWTFAVAISAWFVASYLSHIPALAGAREHTVALALVAILASFVVTIAGIDVTKKTNLILTAFVLVALVGFVAVGLEHVYPTGITPVVTGGALGFLESIGVALTAYGAWTVIPSMAAEVKNPEWTLPRAIIGSLLVVTVLYTAVVFAFQVLVPPGALARGSPVMYAPLSTVAGWTGATVLAHYVLPIAALIAIFTTMVVGMTSTARVLLAMGRRGLLPNVFGTVNQRTQTPWMGLLVVAIGASGFVLLKNLYGQVILAALVGTVIPYVINILSLFGLRRYRPDVSPTFSAPGGRVLPMIALVFLGGTVIGLGVDRPVTTVFVLGGILVGFVGQELFVDTGHTNSRFGAESDD